MGIQVLSMASRIDPILAYHHITIEGSQVAIRWVQVHVDAQNHTWFGFLTDYVAFYHI